MGTAAVILLLMLLMRGGGSTPPPDDSSSDSSGDTPPKDGLLGAAGDLVGAGLGLLGTLGSGGLTVAGTGAGAGAGTAALTGGTAAPAGAAPAGAAPAAAGAAAAGASLVGPITVGLLANPFAWAVYILIASKVVEAQERDKDFQSHLFALNVSAKALHAFERSATWELIKGYSSLLPARLQRDERLDETLLGSRVTLKGYRTVYNFVPTPGQQLVWRKLRYLGLEYLRLRAGHGYRMLRYWKPDVRPPASWGFTDGQYNSWTAMYEEPGMPGAMPGLGGLLQIPLAAGAITETHRYASEDDVYPADVHKLRARSDVADPINDVSAIDLQAVRLAALVEAVHVVRWDVRIIIDLDAEKYAQDVYNALAHPTTRVGVEGLSVSRGKLITDPAVFGQAIAIDPQAIRQQNGRPGVVTL